MPEDTLPDSKEQFHSDDGAVAAGERAVAVGRDGIYVAGSVGGDVLSAGAQKITVTAETAYQVHGLPNPYLGLRSFTYADRLKFGGRLGEVEPAARRLVDPAHPNNLLFVTGASGSGKSSFVQAGLLPALEAHYTGRQKQVRRAVFRPSTAPLALLSDTLDQLGLPPPSVEQLQGFAAADFNGFLAANTPHDQVNLLVIDQFEECFTQSEAGQREKLFALLVGLAPFTTTRTHVIATLRVDYLDELFARADLWQIAMPGIELRAMSELDLKAAILQPLEAAGQADERYRQKRFEPALLDRLALDAARDPTYLPLLQVTLQELWSGGELVLERYGVITDAIRQRADAVLGFADYDSPGPAQARPQSDRDEILDIFTDLVEVSLADDPRRDVRRRREKALLVRDSIQRGRLVDELAGARLLSLDVENREAGRVEVVDIIHESLLANWDCLGEAVAEARRNLQRRTRFEQSLAEWLANDRKDAYLLDGIRLAEGRELERSGDIALGSPQSQQYLSLSAARAEAVQRRRVRVAWAAALGLSVLTLIALAAALYAARQTRQIAVEIATSTARLEEAIFARGTAEAQKSTSQALGTAESASRLAAEAARATAVMEGDISRSRELATIANEQIERDPELAILIALEANQAGRTFQSEDVLRRAVADHHRGKTLQGHARQVNTAVFSPDGAKILTASDDGSARIWDAERGAELVVISGHIGQVSSAVISPDGKQVLTASRDGTARLWDAASGAELHILSGHQGEIYDAVFSPDGKRVLTAGHDGTARLWDAASGAELKTLRGHAAWVYDAAFSPDGRRVVTASGDKTARLWDLESEAEPLVLSGHSDQVLTAAFSPEGRRVVTASFDGTARLWDAENGLELVSLRHSDVVLSARFSPAGEQVLTASMDGTARLWDAESGAERQVLRGHADSVYSALFSEDGSLILTAGGDGTARLWAARNGASLAILRGHTGAIRTAVFSPDGVRLQILTASSDGTARLWQPLSGADQAVLGGPRWSFTRAALSPDGQKVLTSDEFFYARLWDVGSGDELAELDAGGGRIDDADFSQDGSMVLTVSTGEVRLWDVESGKNLVSLWDDILLWKESRSATFSPDGRLVLVIGNDDTARIGDARTGAELAVMRGHEAWIFSAEFSTDGRRVLTRSMDGTARLWEVPGGAELEVLGGQEYGISSAVFSPDGRQVLTKDSDGFARLWDVSKGLERLFIDGDKEDVLMAIFSPEGQRVLTVHADSTVKIWDAQSGAMLATLSGHTGEVTSILFSPDGRHVLTVASDYTARVWDPSNGAQLVALGGPDTPVTGAAFSPDGELVLTMSYDGTARLWNAGSGEQLAVLRDHEGPIEYAAFSSDGLKALTFTQQGRARIFFVDPDDLIVYAKNRLNRQLTCEERVQYLSEERVCPTATPAP